MSQASYRVREFLWVTVPMELDTFCDLLGSKLELPAFHFDAENVYEWGITKTEHGHVEVNISRKHNKGEPLFDEPICILLLVENAAPPIYDSEWITKNLVPVYGQIVANLTGKRAYYGNIEYLGDENFSYHPSKEFEPHS
jgi:hypothetical protein